MKVLVTGSAGFIGFNTCKALLENGDEVIGLDNFNEYYDPRLKTKRNEILESYRNFALVRGDIANEKDLLPAFDRIGSGENTRVCHLAAQAGVRHSIDHPDQFLRDNIQGFGNVIELCKEREVGGLVYASSSSVYGNTGGVPSREDDNTDKPFSLYGATKKANELQAHVYHELFGLRTTGLRFFTVYGPWGRPDMALFLFTNWILSGEPMKIFGEGKMNRDFTFIDDTVSGITAAIEQNYQYEIFNLSSGHSVELMNYVSTLEEALGKEGRKAYLPMQQGDVASSSGDISKAKKMLSYRPQTKIEEGVPRFVEWYREYHQC